MIRIYCFQDTEKENRKERIRNAVRAYTEELGMSFCDEEEWALEKDRRGKPFFPAHPEVSVSVTDSREYWMIAMADHPIGIDLQKRQVRGDMEKLAERFFHPEEAGYILNADNEEEKKIRFFRVWTAKEAYVKYTGQGIDHAFADFCVVPFGGQTGESGLLPDTVFVFRSLYEDYEFCLCLPAGSDTGIDAEAERTMPERLG